jgi:hypothetical protein
MRDKAMTNRRNEIKQINLDAYEFIAKRNAEIMTAYCLIFITLTFALVSLFCVCYRMDAIKNSLGL